MSSVFQTSPVPDGAQGATGRWDLGAGSLRDTTPIILVMSTRSDEVDISSGTCQDAVSFPSSLVSEVEGSKSSPQQEIESWLGTLDLQWRFGWSSRQADRSDDAGRNLVQLKAPPP